MNTQHISCSLIKSLPVNNVLGEGVLWHPEQKSVWWTDIQGSKLFCYWLEEDRTEHWSTPERIGCFGFVENKPELIVAFESGIAFFNVFDNALEWLAKPESTRIGNRFNDGRVDRNGRFWAGCMVEKAIGNEQSAGLYMVDEHLDVTQQLDGIQISNGLCWSPDGSVMYHADSLECKIYRFNCHQANGRISNKQLFASTEENIHPDGSTVDSLGGIWNAQWGGSQVVRYAPDGEISFILSVPVSQPTCVSFGGPDMDLLFVTTARDGLSKEQLDKEPEAGNLLIYQTNIKGLSEPFFKPNKAHD